MRIYTNVIYDDVERTKKIHESIRFYRRFEGLSTNMHVKLPNDLIGLSTNSLNELFDEIYTMLPKQRFGNMAQKEFAIKYLDMLFGSKLSKVGYEEIYNDKEFMCGGDNIDGLPKVCIFAMAVRIIEKSS